MLKSKLRILPVVLVVSGCGRTTTDEVTTEGKAPEAVLWSNGAVLDAKFDPNAGVIVTASDDGTVRRWDARTGAPLGGPIQVLPFAREAEVGPRGEVVFIGDEGVVQLWRSVDAPSRRLISHDGTAATISSDSEWVLTGGKDGVARVFSSTSGVLVMELTGHEDAIWWLRCGSDGKRLVAGGDSPVGSIWDISSSSRTALVGHTKSIMGGSLSPDNSKVLTVSWDTTAKVWEAETGQLLATLSGHAGYLWVGEFSPDGSKIVTGGADRTARIWDSSSGELLAKASGHVSTISSIAFEPSGSIFVTGSWDDGTARVWGADTAREIEQRSMHFGQLNSVVIDAGGEYLLTASEDHTAALWRLGGSFRPETGWGRTVRKLRSASPFSDLVNSGLEGSF